MGDSNKVSAGKPKVAGAVFIGKSGATAPTDAKTELGSGFTSLGYVGDEGVSNDNSRSSNDIKEWGGQIVDSNLEEVKDIWKLKFIESMNVDVLKAVYGDESVTTETSGAIKVSAGAEESKPTKWVFDMILKGGMLKRIYIPNGKITSLKEITYNRTDPIAYDVEITAYPDTDGKSHYEWIEKETSA